MKSFFKFFGRQLGTKTGRYAGALIAGAVVNSIPEVSANSGAVVDAVMNPQIAAIGLLGMFLRDNEAKKTQK